MTRDYAPQSAPRAGSYAAAIFRPAADWPSALPGRHAWLTRSEDLREIEQLLGLVPSSLTAPLWMSGDRRLCTGCGREPSWLDVVKAALVRTGSRRQVSGLVTGEQGYLNVEAPHGIAGLSCCRCGSHLAGFCCFKGGTWRPVGTTAAARQDDAARI